MWRDTEQLQQMIRDGFGAESYYLGSLQHQELEDNDWRLRRTSLFGLIDHPKWRYCFAIEQEETEDPKSVAFKFTNRVPGLDYSDLEDSLHELHPYALERFVADLLGSSGRYSEVHEQALVQEVPVDVMAVEVDPQGNQPFQHLFEVKQLRVGTVNLVREMIRQKDILTKGEANTDFTLVIAGRLNAGARALAHDKGLLVWDIETLGDRLLRTPDFEILEGRYFGKRVLPLFWRLMLGAGSGTSPREISLPPLESLHRFEEEPISSSQREAETLVDSLRAIRPGQEDWPKYQQLTGKIVEYLFVPPLGKIHYEQRDSEARNRRDLIVENWASHGFWAQMRDVYDARLVVIDAKNSSKPLEKEAVVDIAHYLKPHGCGMFGILFSRKGDGDPAKHAIREQWIGGRKMIIVVSDREVEEMIRLRAEDGRPEELLREKIAEFLMSL